jgi:hypothetical protein
LLAALSADDDLGELRALVQGSLRERARAEGFVAEHAAHFELRARSAAREQRTLSRAELLDLLAGTYRGERRRQRAAVEALGELAVTLASDVVLLARR